MEENEMGDKSRRKVIDGQLVETKNASTQNLQWRQKEFEMKGKRMDGRNEGKNVGGEKLAKRESVLIIKFPSVIAICKSLTPIHSWYQ